ncbi:shikimate kinase [Ornithinimicrobium sediminis]|uniref:shikimate kinase n=1 Tax=Ornithinimicrobium sediminis TaxID=2904603 RepID=UPI001E382AAB|nr:shikimate kinase [Ornithinimicrobium sediminis]MCE0488360.1 shikimate kinase [Ornithinimicrobium sediminis]
MSELPRLVLVGPPGAGKSTVGAQVAQRLGLEHHDTDAAIVRAQGRSISDIFVDDGEAVFRALERGEVLRALGSPDVVLSLGGGAVMDPDVQAALSGHTVVFLDVSIADAAGRVGFDASRPMLVVNPRASWMRLMQARRPVYEALATWRVDTAGRTPQEVTDEVVALLGTQEAL